MPSIKLFKFGRSKKSSKHKEDKAGTQSEAPIINVADKSKSALPKHMVKSDKRSQSEPIIRPEGAALGPRRKSSSSLSSMEQQRLQRLAQIQQLDGYMAHLCKNANDDTIPCVPSRLCCAQLIKRALVEKERQYIKDVLHGKISKRLGSVPNISYSGSEPQNDESDSSDTSARRLQKTRRKSVHFKVGGQLADECLGSCSDGSHDEPDQAEPTISEDECFEVRRFSLKHSDDDDWLNAYRQKSTVGGRRQSMPAFLLDIY